MKPLPPPEIPAYLLQPHSAPPFRVQVWGDYVDYVEQLAAVLRQCNSDKRALSALVNGGQGNPQH